MPVALPDVLSSDGQYVYMRSQRSDMEGMRQEIGPMNVTQQEGEVLCMEKGISRTAKSIGQKTPDRSVIMDMDFGSGILF
ncbi:unnamed protein product [marine sediment metagenome]|uniref:Uncharacterized protein n=1 Tax=marine sediment metagenome TaxID=412755 RepID=X0U6V1_9ZZZZ